MSRRFDRQSFLGEHSEDTFATCYVGIVGLGGGGSHVVQQLAHLGVKNFYLFDHDSVDETNLNRLVGAKAIDIRTQASKTAVARRVIKGINPGAQVRGKPGKWQDYAEVLRGCDVIFGCVDSFSERWQLETQARRYLIPYIDIGMDVHKVQGKFVIGGQVFLSMPGQHCMRCVGLITDDSLAREAAQYGEAGSRPQVVWPNGVLASLAIGVFVQLFTPWADFSLDTVYLEYEGNSQQVTSSRKPDVLAGITCPHYGRFEDLGDPFWVARKIPKRWRSSRQRDTVAAAEGSL